MKNNNIRLMYCIAFLQGMVFYASIATLYRTSAGLSLYQISIIESISYMLTVGLEIPWGIIADRIGYRATMIFCTVLYFLSKIVFWQSASFSMFLLERVMLSVVFSGLSGVDTSILYLSDKENSQKVFSIYGALGTAGMILSSLITAVWIKDQYRLSGFLTILPYAAAAVLVFFLKEVKSSKKRQNLHEILATLNSTVHHRTLLFLVIGAGLLFESLHMIMVFLNQPIYTAAGMNTSWISFVFIGMTLIGLLEVYSAPLTKRIGRKKTGMMLFLISGLSSVLLAFTSNRYIAVGCIAIVNLSYALFMPLFTAYEHGLVHSGDRATAISVGASIMDLIAPGVDLLIGKASDLSLFAACICSAVLILAGSVFWMLAVSSTSMQKTKNLQ